MHVCMKEPEPWELIKVRDLSDASKSSEPEKARRKYDACSNQRMNYLWTVRSLILARVTLHMYFVKCSVLRSRYY